MSALKLCSEQDIRQMVDAFYARVREDALLGPIFDQHVDDWPRHLQLLSDFWSHLLLGTGRFSGTPMPKHIALPDLRAELFMRWLSLFRITLDELPNRELADAAWSRAQRIAQSLWLGYQGAHRPEQLPERLPLN